MEMYQINFLKCCLDVNTFFSMRPLGQFSQFLVNRYWLQGHRKSPICWLTKSQKLILESSWSCSTQKSQIGMSKNFKFPEKLGALMSEQCCTSLQSVQCNSCCWPSYLQQLASISNLKLATNKKPIITRNNMAYMQIRKLGEEKAKRKTFDIVFDKFDKNKDGNA